MCYLGVLALVVAVSSLADHHLSKDPGYPAPFPRFGGDWLLGGLVRFDGGWYLEILENGYTFAGPDQQSAVAFFPAYPTATWLVAQVVGNATLALVVVTVVAGLVATVLLHDWVRRRLDERTARVAVAVLVVFPYAWYLFGAAYADALFLASVLAAFVLVDRDHPVLAGLAGALATAGRPVGAAVIVGLAAVHAERRGLVVLPRLDAWRRAGTGPRWWRPDAGADGTRERDPVGQGSGADTSVAATVTEVPARPRLVETNLRRLRPGDAGVLLSVAGLGAWSTYLWVRWGDPFLFATVQQAPGWDQGAGPRTWFKAPLVDRLENARCQVADLRHGTANCGPRPGPELLYTGGVLVQGLLLVLAAVVTVLVVRRLGWGIATYNLLVVLPPLLGSKDFQGSGRYVLAAFPSLVVLATVLVDRPVARRAWLVASGIALVVLTHLYARGYYVA